ncbi:MAG: transposase [Clostridia bacterium]|nr:transposase [Clostridia bacterium]
MERTEIWLSLAEAAELEQLQYITIYKRIDAEKSPETTLKYGYKVKYVPNSTGGKDLVYIELSSLSEAAQERYKQRMYAKRRQERARRALQNKQPPWYTDVDIGWYMHEYKREYMEKTALCSEIEKYLEQKTAHRKGVTEFCESFAREHLDMSGKQFRRYLQRYDEGLKWAELAEGQDGQNYQFYRILALCTPPKKGKHVKLTPEIMAKIENLWASEEHHRNRQSVQLLYDDLCRDMKGAEWIPSYNTVKRYCDELEAKYSGAASLMKDGERQWKNTTMQKRLRNTSSLRVMELWQGDAHTFDCWIQVTKPNGTVTAVRPYLVAFVDTRSRCIAAWGICLQPNSEVIKQVLIHGMYPKSGSPVQGVPRIVLIDNGKDFTAQTLTGRPRTQRFDIDGEIRGFYKALGIESDMRALPYQAWTKAQMERFFGTLCSRFSKKFPSYTGTLTGSRTDAKVKKDIKGMLERGELHTLDEFAAMFEAYLEDYHERRHSGLAKQHEENPRPLAVYKNAERYDCPAPPLEYALSLLGTMLTRTVSNIGIELGKQRYMSAELAAYIGEKVTVRMNEGDTNTVICYTSDGHLIGRAYRTEMLNPLAEKEDAALIEHIKNQRQQLRRTKEDIVKLRTPYEERIALPKITGENAKVVRVVSDNQYIEELTLKATKSRKVRRQKQDINDFMRSQAEKAIERLEKLG